MESPSFSFPQTFLRAVAERTITDPRVRVELRESMQRKEILVGDASELKEGERKIVPLDNTEVGVYRVNGKLYAYENLCAHQGGPACEGLLMPKVEEVLGENKTYQSRRFNYGEWHIVCPWHAWEYELTTGEFVVNRKFRLKKYEVIETEGRIYVLPG